MLKAIFYGICLFIYLIVMAFASLISAKFVVSQLEITVPLMKQDFGMEPPTPCA